MKTGRTSNKKTDANSLLKTVSRLLSVALFLCITFLLLAALAPRAAAQGGIIETFPVGSFPIHLAFDGANIWVTNYDDDTVTKVRESDGALLGTFPVSGGPYSITFEDAYIWVGSVNHNTLNKL